LKLSIVSVGRDSGVTIETFKGPAGSEIEPRCGWNFPHSSRPVLGQPQPIQGVPGSFPGGKAAGAWHGFDHPRPSSAEVKERVGLYLCLPLGLRGLF